MNIAQSAVGSAVANCTHFLANYPQLANPCQLKVQVNQGNAGNDPQLATLPTCQLAQTRVVAGLSPILQLAKTPPPTT
ncbi:MAG TPA: hypothetical protein PK667_00555 [Nitrosomonas europaea]|uniref:hypothetical protein n=1 Tax=Nitrosomonas europaea TaxID=915 RepID=UPI002C28FE98|nr:hypothetical protein [Nitrosomonas europaea]HUM72668.1 hypothetical protein [Nitrosomonas europaea]